MSNGVLAQMCLAVLMFPQFFDMHSMDIDDMLHANEYCCLEQYYSTHSC